jgi:hypothetical protein
MRFGVITVASGKSRATSASDRVLLEQPRAGACDQHRVDDERHAVRVEVVRDGLDQHAREEHPRLRRVDADVVRRRRRARARTKSGRQLVDRRHRGRVLRGQRDESAHAVGAGGRERLQIGLDAGTPPESEVAMVSARGSSAVRSVPTSRR